MYMYMYRYMYTHVGTGIDIGNLVGYSIYYMYLKPSIIIDAFMLAVLV